MAMLATTEEKRSGIRLHFRASIVYAPFNTSNYHTAEVIDVGQKGMCFRSGAPLKPGAVVFIRMENYSGMIPNIRAEARLRTVTLAEVKWCRELYRKFEILYDIGVMYLPPDR